MRYLIRPMMGGVAFFDLTDDSYQFYERLACQEIPYGGRGYNFPSAFAAVHAAYYDPTFGTYLTIPALSLGLSNSDSYYVTLAGSLHGCENLDSGISIWGVNNGELFFSGTKRRLGDRWALRVNGEVQSIAPSPTNYVDPSGCPVMLFSLAGFISGEYEVVEIAGNDLVNVSSGFQLKTGSPLDLNVFNEFFVGGTPPPDEDGAFAGTAELTKLEFPNIGIDAIVLAEDSALGGVVTRHLRSKGVVVDSLFFDGPTNLPQVQGYYQEALLHNQMVGYERSGGIVGPTLYLVGTNSSTGVAYGISGIDSTRCDRTCLSDYIYTVDEMFGPVPLGPVSRIPGRTVDQIQGILDLADCYSNQSCQHSAKNVCVMSSSNGGAYSDVDDMVNSIYRRSDYNVQPLIFPNSGVDVVNLFNSGLNELWGFGYSTSFSWYGVIKNQQYSSFSTDQAFVAFLPTCKIALTGEYIFPDFSVAGQMMLGEAGNLTRMAGGVGQITGGWEDHELIILSELASMRKQYKDQAILLSDLAFLAVQSFCQKFPNFSEHALGLGVLGGDVYLSPILDTAGVEAGLETNPNLEFNVLCRGDILDIHFKVGAGFDGNGQAELFDIRGRRIGSKDFGYMVNSGWAKWDGISSSGIPLPSGVYFLRLKVASNFGEISSVTKFVNLK